MRAIGRDFRQAVVALVRSPSTAILATVLLGLGTGVNTTVFSVASAVLMRQPPGVREPDRLVRVHRLEEDGSHGSLSYFEYEHVRDRNHVFESVGGYVSGGAPVLIGADAPEPHPATAGFVSGSFFETVGVRPFAGRLLSARDDAENAAPTVVLSHAFWHRAYDGRPGVIGQALSVNGQPHSIVGIASPEFRSLGVDEVPPDVWLPFWARPAVLGRPVSELVRTGSS